MSYADAYQFLLLAMVVFGGAVVVTFNTRVLGGKITFFESVSILGYCIFPLFIMGGIIKLLTIINFAHLLIKLALVIGGIIWGVICTILPILSGQGVHSGQCGSPQTNGGSLPHLFVLLLCGDRGDVPVKTV